MNTPRRLILLTLTAATAAAALSLATRGPKEVLLGSYSTTLQGRTSAQSHNARLATGKLTNATIGPGETFSFNQQVGTWSRDAGYRRAPVSYNGTLIDAWGGGVCQSSTTLYNAAILAGLKIEERSPHRFAPSYAPPGRDAAVAFGDIDLRLKNTYDFPLTIKGKIEGDRLVVRIYGTESPAERPIIQSEILDVKPAGTFLLTGRGNSGRIRNNGKSGFEVRTYRLWPTHRELLSSDSYPAMQRIIEYR